MIEMKVSGIVLDPQSRNPIVVLRDVPERRALMIWIGPPEASSIMLALEKVTLARPATHDLFATTLEQLGVKVVGVAINRMQENTFFAAFKIQQKDGTSLEIDARPSDAIALALRAGAPIFVAEEVMISSSIPINPVQEEQETKDFKEFIDNIKPSDFIKQAREKGSN